MPTSITASEAATRAQRAATPPLLPRWLTASFRVDTDHVSRFREINRRHEVRDPDNYLGDYLWYQEVNNRLEEREDPHRLVVVSREGRQQYVTLSSEFQEYFAGARRWGRRVFVRPGLMEEPVRKYRTITSIFGHSELSTVLTKRVSKGKNLDTIGLEIEVNVPSSGSDNAHGIATRIYNEGRLDIRGGRFVMPCYDGSLGSNGVEYKTGIFDMDFWNGKTAEDWRQRFAAQNFQGFKRAECGLHINIGRNNTFSSSKICHMAQAFLFSPYWSYDHNNRREMPEVYKATMKIAGRYYLRNQYASGSEISYNRLGHSQKYQPMRMGGDRVEFRIFQSTTNPVRLKMLPQFCIEIGKAVTRLEDKFDMSKWNDEGVFRKEWGRLVWASILQHSENVELVAWLQSKIPERATKIFREIVLPVPAVMPEAAQILGTHTLVTIGSATSVSSSPVTEEAA